MKEFWNERFAEPDYIYGVMPNAYFQQFIDSSDTGTILLPAEGEGRNALYALQSGWQVHAVDYSEEGRKKALKLAKDNDFELKYSVADLAEWNEDVKVDAIALLYAHFPPQLRSAIHSKLISKLKPGGTLVMEAFSREQMQFNSGGPRNLEMLYSKSMLEEDFSTLNVEYIEELNVEINEGEYHKGKASVIRLIAKK